MKNSRKLDSPKRSIIDKKKKRLVNDDSHENENSDVLVSAVISPYLLTHLHHIHQQSEYHAQKDGRKSHAANFAKLRKVLCLDARSMADASAKEINDADNDLSINKLSLTVGIGFTRWISTYTTNYLRGREGNKG